MTTATTTPLAKRWPIRATRVFLAAVFLWNAFWAVHSITAGHVIGATISLALLPAVALTLVWQVRYIHRADARRLRPRPDYSLIASMERELYGETFEHEGAPEQGWQEAGAFAISAPPTMPPEPPLPRPRRRDDAKCWCSYCNGRRGVHGPDAIALYRAQCEAAMRESRCEKCDDDRGGWNGSNLRWN